MLSVTIYNKYRNRTSNKEEWLRTVLTGRRAGGRDAIHWEDNRAANVIASGLTTADAVEVMIWHTVDTGGKTYLPPKAFAALSPEDAIKHWTLAPQDRLLKGAAPDGTLNDILPYCDAEITITSVDAMDYGSDAMRHWEVSGK